MVSAKARARLEVAKLQRSGSYLRDNLREDRLAIQPMEPGRRRNWMRLLAWVSIASLFVLGGWYGSSIRSFDRLGHGGQYTPANYTPEVFTSVLIRDCATIFLAVALILIFLRRSPRFPRMGFRSRIRAFFAYYGLFLTAIGLAKALSMSLGIDRYPYPQPTFSQDWLQVLNITNSAFAGPCEELALLMLPVVALRRTGHPWWLIFLVAATLRVPFHMYYGWTTVVFALWAVGAVVLYRRMATIIPLILAHSVNNTIVGLSDLGEAWSLLALGTIAAWATSLFLLGLYLLRYAENKPGLARHHLLRREMAR